MSVPSPARLARHLIGFPTVNPPGDEGAAQSYLREVLEQGGMQVEVLEKEAGRPNLVCRLPGRGERAALVLHGHVDVVGADGQVWEHPPFGAREEGGILHGRGALDMKSGVAMMTHAVLRAAHEGIQPAGDVVLAVVCDSESGGTAGLAHLLSDHAELFSGSAYAVGEFGGFPLHAFGRRFYRIGVALKQYVHLRLRLSGAGGHGSRPARGTVVGRLGEVLTRLDRSPLPHHRSAVAEQVVESLTAALPSAPSSLLGRLLHADTFESALAELGHLAGTFESLFRDTANATIVRAGDKFNVVPSAAHVEVDVRLLPGRTVEEALEDILSILGGDDLDVEVVAVGPPSPDHFDPGLLATLSAILGELDPDAVPVPYLFNESPDGRLFAAAGVQHYGFLPMDLPPDLDLPELIHGPNERVPLHSLSFGAEALYRLIAGY